MVSFFLVLYLESLSRGSRGGKYHLDGCEYDIGTVFVNMHDVVDNEVTVWFPFEFMSLDLIGVVVS